MSSLTSEKVVNMNFVYKNVWLVLNETQLLELRSGLDNDVREVLEEVGRKLTNVLLHIDPDRKLPSVYADGDDGEDIIDQLD